MVASIYRVIKEAGISVADASAMWYLQVLATTVTMTIPLAPQLRMKILEHTKYLLYIYYLCIYYLLLLCISVLNQRHK